MRADMAGSSFYSMVRPISPGMFNNWRIAMYVPKEGEVVSYRVDSPGQGVFNGTGLVMRVEGTSGGNWRVRVRTDRTDAATGEPLTWSLFTTNTVFEPMQQLGWFRKNGNCEVAQFGELDFAVAETDEGFKAYVHDSYEALKRSADEAKRFCEKVAFGLIEKRPIVEAT